MSAHDAPEYAQGLFRQQLLEMWEGCAVTDVRLPTVLRASHIKPWRFSSNSERLNPYYLEVTDAKEIERLYLMYERYKS